MEILSLPGGGIGGIVTLCILRKIEEAYQNSITNLFDLIVGTSTGGIIACAYGKGMSTNQILNLYLDHASKIFGRDFLWKVKSKWGVVNSKYDGSGMFEVLFDEFGDDLLMNSKVRVITTSYNTISQKLFLFDSKDKNHYTYVDACMATAAAPTYFPPYIISKQEQYIDGAIIAPDPSFIGSIEGTKSIEPFHLTSVGTGYFPLEPYFTDDWGILKFLLRKGESPLINMTLGGGKQMMSYGNKKLDFDVYDIDLPFKLKMDESNKDVLQEVVNYCMKYPININIRK